MIFKTIYNLSLSDFSYMLETNDFKKMSFVPFFSKKKAEKFNDVMTAFTELVSKDELNSFLTNEVIKLRLYNLVKNYLPSLYIGLKCKYSHEFADEYKKRYRKEFKTLSDLNVIVKEIETLKRKYDMFNKENPEPEKQDGNIIEKIITGIEITLNIPINRSMSVYQIKYYFDNAQKKIASYGNNR